MFLKRFYKPAADGETHVGYHKHTQAPLALDHVALIHTGTHAEQNFAPQMVEQGQREGWLKLDGKKLTLLVRPEPLVYTIKRGPGRYCLHCDVQLADDDRGVLARQHVSTKHPGERSPDPAVPAGYVKLNHYETVLEAAQHKRFKAKPGVPLTVQHVAAQLKKGA